MEWLEQNKQWVFSGVGVLIVSVLGSALYRLMRKGGVLGEHSKTNTISVAINNNNTYNDKSSEAGTKTEETSNIDAFKGKTYILFIDDDANFKVVSILKKAGWINTKRVKDISSLDCSDVREAHILFVDIQGVGLSLECRDEGLGLALILKKKYPDKKIVIYSAESKGDRFHEALRKADTFLPKNAEPYEFQQIVEEYSMQLFKK